ncbi:MAG: DUF924 family protein [Pseudomonadota bacterium]
MVDSEHSTWRDAVLEFWFEQHGRADWFAQSDAFDDDIRSGFPQTYDHVRTYTVDDLISEPRTALAAVIVLDQFPRNMFRNSPRGFESDAPARAVSRAAIESGFDAHLTTDQRMFLYLPFEHSEELSDQDRSVALFRALGDAEYLDYAEKHRDLIVKFGRFPHRNAVLGRASTDAELSYLREFGRGF